MTLSRREFLGLPLALLLPPQLGRANPIAHSATYHADIAILFGLFTLTLNGDVEEEVDRIAGRYRVVAAGAGSEIASRIESVGRIRERRFTPDETTLIFTVRGRESRTHLTYDHTRGVIHYRHTSETFFLRHRRVAEDTIKVPPGQVVDDIVTATLNYAEGLLETDGRGGYRTFVVRRARREQEEPDEVQPGGYHAEIVPVRFTVTRDEETGRPVALMDLTPFSSWATPSNPARMTFGANGRPLSLQVSLILGTRVNVAFHALG